MDRKLQGRFNMGKTHMDAIECISLIRDNAVCLFSLEAGKDTTMNTAKDTFLWQALEELDGWGGVLLPADLYEYLVNRDGTCTYSVDELEAWLNEESEEQA